MLANVIGDEDTILPRDAETGDQLHVMSCWKTPPEGFEEMIRREAGGNADVAARLRAEWLCPPGTEPQRTGRGEGAAPP